MAQEPASDDQMIRYLLGDLPAEEQARLEEQYFTDDRVFEQLPALEDELIHDYLRGELSDPVRQQFERHFLASPERRQKLEFARAFETHLSRASASAVPGVAAGPEPQGRGIAPTQPHGAAWRWALAAAGVAVVVLAAWLAVENKQLRSRLRQMQAEQAELRKHDAQLRQQLAKLDEQLRQRAPGSGEGREMARVEPLALPSVSLVLVPGLPRSAGGQNALVIPPGPHIVRLRLRLEDQSSKSYLATLETAEGSNIWPKQAGQGRVERHGGAVVFNLPSSLFRTDDYVLRLSAVGTGGEIEEVAAYGFRVVRR